MEALAWSYLVYVEVDELLVLRTESLEHPWKGRKEKGITADSCSTGLATPGDLGAFP